MSELAVTIIDVGWGDSIFIESTDDQNTTRYALVDCNDYENERSAYIFVKRYFDRAGVAYEDIQRNFTWALLTHGHADHARGLKRMLSTFGAENFWYPKSVPSTSYGSLLSYANASSKVGFHQAIDRTKVFDTVDFGDVSMEVLWPEHDQIDASNENNNSIVMALTLGQVTFVLTGDAEAENWPNIVARIPGTTKIFQAPHHGALNGMFDHAGTSPWLDHLAGTAAVAMSSHIRPHGHPHPNVIAKLEDPNAPVVHYRTDRHYHLTFRTDGNAVHVQYSHV